MQLNHRLPPYARGGAPGALVAFKVGEAILSVLTIVGIGVLLAGRSLQAGAIASWVAMAVGMALSIADGIGALRYHRGSPDGAALMRRIWTIRRVLLVASMVYVAVSSFSALSQSFVAGMISLILYEGTLVLELMYVNSARDAMDRAAIELETGEPTLESRPNHLSGIACFNCAVTLLMVPVVLLNRNMLTRYLPMQAIRFVEVIALAFFLVSARFALVVACNRGFKRAHADPGSGAFTPVGRGPARALDVLGAILLSWVALERLIAFYNAGGMFAAPSLSMMVVRAISCVPYALGCGALAAGLAARRRDALTVAGGLLLLTGAALNLHFRDFSFIGMDALAFILPMAACGTLLAVAGGMGCVGRKVPAALRAAIIVTGVGANLYSLGNVIHLVSVNITSNTLMFPLAQLLRLTLPWSAGLIAAAMAVGRAPEADGADLPGGADEGLAPSDA